MRRVTRQNLVDDRLRILESRRILPHTVEWHVRHVIEKLQVHTMLQAVIAAVRRGLIDLGSAP